MITFELPRGYTEAKRMTVTQKMVKLKLNIESVIRAELIILEQTYELCTRFWLGGVTSQLAQASNRATIPLGHSTEIESALRFLSNFAYWLFVL